MRGSAIIKLSFFIRTQFDDLRLLNTRNSLCQSISLKREQSKNMIVRRTEPNWSVGFTVSVDILLLPHCRNGGYICQISVTNRCNKHIIIMHTNMV